MGPSAFGCTSGGCAPADEGVVTSGCAPGELGVAIWGAEAAGFGEGGEIFRAFMQGTCPADRGRAPGLLSAVAAAASAAAEDGWAPSDGLATSFMGSAGGASSACMGAAGCFSEPACAPASAAAAAAGLLAGCMAAPFSVAASAGGADAVTYMSLAAVTSRMSAAALTGCCGAGADLETGDLGAFGDLGDAEKGPALPVHTANTSALALPGMHEERVKEEGGLDT